MHGGYGSNNRPSARSLEFAANTYAQITLAVGCSTNQTYTLEEDMLGTGAQLKTANSAVQVGMYWRADFALELAACSGFAAEWAAHPEYRLKMDNGTVLDRQGSFYIDYTNPDAATFFAKVVVNVTRATLSSGHPVLDYVYIDGDPPSNYIFDGINAARSAQIVRGYYTTFADIQRQLDNSGRGQRVILNGMDDQDSANTHVGSGCGGAMFDHWSILQVPFISAALHHKLHLHCA